MRVLDAGCGAGRNLVYFLKSGYEVFGVDESAPHIAQVRQMAAALAPHLPAENFRVEPVERMSWGARSDPPAIPIHRDPHPSPLPGGEGEDPIRSLSQPKAALPHPGPLPGGEGDDETG